MSHYTVLPLEVVMDGLGSAETAGPLLEVVINGVTMQVQPLNGQQASIVRLLSPNPQDFLNPQYTPGRLIEFQAVLAAE